MNHNAVTLTFRRILNKVNLKGIRIHDLRHTHATLMLIAGIHPKVVSERLGHANIWITLDTYSHVLPGMQENAVEKFDLIFNEGVSKNSDTNVSKMLANGEGVECRPCRSRTCDTLIKSQVLCRLPTQEKPAYLGAEKSPLVGCCVQKVKLPLSRLADCPSASGPCGPP